MFAQRRYTGGGVGGREKCLIALDEVLLSANATKRLEQLARVQVEATERTRVGRADGALECKLCRAVQEWNALPYSCLRRAVEDLHVVPGFASAAQRGLTRRPGTIGSV